MRGYKLSALALGCAVALSGYGQMPDEQSYVKPGDAALRQSLTPLAYRVTQRDATERSFDNAFWDHHADGIYVDVVSGEPLFSSTDKYQSGTGWPSFTRAIDDRYIVTKNDDSWFFRRIELRSRLADSHLGHLFDDGPPPAGKRYCINSAALRFVPKEDMQREGYGAYLALFD